MSGGLRRNKLGTKAQRQESARAGANSAKNVKKPNAGSTAEMGPVTCMPNPLKLESSLRGARPVRKAR